MNTCPHCKYWNSDIDWVVCGGCRLPSSRFTAPVVALPPPRTPHIVLGDSDLKGTHLELVGLGRATEGQVLAVLPEKDGYWSFLLRRKSESLLDELHKKLADAAEQEEASKKAHAAVQQQLEDMTKSRDQQRLVRTEQDASLRRLGDENIDLRVRLQKLEDDLGKVRTAVGSVRYNEILVSGV